MNKAFSSEILFVHSQERGYKSSFVTTDFDLLSKHYKVEELSIAANRSVYLRTLLNPSIWAAVARTRLVFGWFGACTPVILIATALRKPSILIGGGSDVASVPSIGYGLVTDNRVKRYLLLLGFRLASRVLMFSESSRQTLLQDAGISSKNVEALYLAVDGSHFVPAGHKLPRALTISYIDPMNYKRKGLDTFMDAARQSDEIEYRLGGKPEDRLLVEQIEAAASANLTYLGYLDSQRLLSEYQQAKVYCQLSVHEGFGLSLAEAMACECIPVVTNTGSIPEVVGDTGFYVPIADSSAAAKVVREAVLSADVSLGHRSRERILDLFPVSRREQGLRMAVEAAMR